MDSKTQVFTISNQATTAFVLSDIVLSDTDNYALDMNAGPDPCGSTTPKISPGGECTFAVTFYPKSTGILDSDITIMSDDPSVPHMSVPLEGFGLLCYC